LLQGPLGRLAPIGDLQALQFPVGADGRVQRNGLDLALPVPLAEAVLTRVQRDLAQPCRDLAFPAEGAECPVGIDEGVLGQFGGRVAPGAALHQTRSEPSNSQEPSPVSSSARYPSRSLSESR